MRRPPTDLGGWATQSTSDLSFRCGSLRPSIHADVRCIDDVIAIEGRAISVAEVISATTSARWELQLKGGGTTPFCRGADGRAVLRSSIREFLASEAMHHLGVSTTRALSLIQSGSEVVMRPWYSNKVRPCLQCTPASVRGICASVHPCPSMSIHVPVHLCAGWGVVGRWGSIQRYACTHARTHARTHLSANTELIPHSFVFWGVGTTCGAGS